MSAKYRIIFNEGDWLVQEKSWFFWSYLRHGGFSESIMRFGSCEQALKTIENLEKDKKRFQ